MAISRCDLTMSEDKVMFKKQLLKYILVKICSLELSINNFLIKTISLLVYSWITINKALNVNKNEALF